MHLCGMAGWDTSKNGMEILSPSGYTHPYVSLILIYVSIAFMASMPNQPIKGTCSNESVCNWIWCIHTYARCLLG